MELIILHKGTAHTVLIDDADRELVKGYQWHIQPNPIKKESKYVRGYLKSVKCRDQKLILMHRLLMGTPPDGMWVDHENQNGLDCRRGNMRFITKAGNNRNKTTIKKSNLPKGVGITTVGRFMANIRIDKINRYLGVFATPEEAGDAYQTAYNKQIKKEI
jgi:hypothetical protein